MKATHLFRYLMVILVVLASLAPASLAEARRPVVKFRSPIVTRSEGPGIWTIGEQEVEVTAQTRLFEEEGQAEVGALVMVIAQEIGRAHV